MTLVGDAAHAMLPFLGQGACSTLEDVVALAAALRNGHGDLEDALRAYEAQRRPRTDALIRGSRVAAGIALLRSGPMRAIRDTLVSRGPARIRLRQYDRAMAVD